MAADKTCGAGVTGQDTARQAPVKEKPAPLEKLPQPEQSSIKHTIAVMSGKGGVGKSTVTALLAAALAKEQQAVGILDADITGPSIPKLFGLKEQPVSSPMGIIPPKTLLGIRVMSLNLLLPHEDDPVIWRGPLIAGAVRQFWTDVIWGDLDYLVIDLPPGTGDAPLTVLQSLPLDGIIIVSSPQELAIMVVKKAVKMAAMLNVPVLGLVENMAYLACPHCGEKIELFGPSRAAAVSKELGLPYLGSFPVDPKLAEVGDRGEIERYQADFPVDFLLRLEKGARPAH
ncbi:Mrp/NBP35 family ATP-binding protein [Gelria sp. Kuro-4]|uniref:Mrp/NBP35 family ATP-binding protein n=1 Tax=Gelria sp. Kuro-4 TaxID=2796927 RepID=UPI001BEE0743|nr:Mrp/NBP35 family ATP-binding protein [Gelria sp. Kuro-4]BCV23470.1 iron-sulfur cluster carrier protein [Gelria sp. Kuro-4]